jgi:NADH-quinone oxidoreductase subunit J
MNVQEIIFYLIAAYILGTGIMAVTTNRIFRAAIWLLFSLVGIASLYFWMDLEFIAAIQIVVYVGGIVVLIIFSVFLTQKAGDEMPVALKSRTLPAAFASLFALAFTANILLHHNFGSASNVVFDPNMDKIGMAMLNTGDGGFILPFETVSMLLLAALIGCIVIAMKIKKEETQ